MPEDIERIPREIFEEAGLVLDDRMNNFLVVAGRPSLYVEKMSWPYAVSTIFLAKSLERSLKEHAQALTRSAQAAEKHARSLAFATWALVAATIALVIFAGAQIFLSL